MSLSYTCDVHCDMCGDWIHGVTKSETIRLATEAINKAKRSGWSRVTKSIYTDLCPHCLDKNRKDPK
jgi:hypothetical protein